MCHSDQRISLVDPRVTPRSCNDVIMVQVKTQPAANTRQGWDESERATGRMKDTLLGVFEDFAENTTAHAPPKVGRCFLLSERLPGTVLEQFQQS